MTPEPSAAVPATETLLEARNLVKDFAVTKGAVLQRRVGAVSAVADVSFDDLRAVRRSA